MNQDEVVPTIFVGLAGIVAMFAIRKSFTRSELWLLVPAVAAHYAASFFHIWLMEDYYEIGDFNSFVQTGHDIANAISANVMENGSEALAMLFQRRSVMGEPSSTNSVNALCGLLMFAVGGSRYAMNLACALYSAFGKLGLYATFRSSLPLELHRRALIAAMLIPSVVLWSGGLTKEALAVGSLGCMLYGLHSMIAARRPSGIASALAGAVGVFLFKPYILVAAALSTGVWLYWARALRRDRVRAVTTRPLYLALGIVVIVGSMALLGALVPQFAATQIYTSASQTREAGADMGGGSDYSIDAETQGVGGGSRVVLAPLALVTALYRPALFDVNGVLVFLQALEGTLFAGLTLQALLARKWRDLWRTMRTSPILMFSATFCIVFGAGVGLATTNFGTLARYRMPLVPFFALILLVLTARRAPASAPLPVSMPRVVPVPARA